MFDSLRLWLLCIHRRSNSPQNIDSIARECELACDQTVLKVLSPEERSRYGHLLLEVAERQIVNRSAFTALAFSPSATTLRERIDQSQNFTQTTWRSRVAAAVFVFAIAVLGLTDGRPQAAMTDELRVATTPDEPRVVAATNEARVAAIETAAPGTRGCQFERAIRRSGQTDPSQRPTWEFIVAGPPRSQ